ncbi:hypothetical protein [Luteolibacter luteus]|uniref:HAF repeat-containing protein n=1 Tax=Luteolibacter luteus TaxID=2728835 RepID=A0A858RNT7_9BACT|nr:hypothetical protein [Luteolibacter luteus]QJE98088.1 hypothetical protein HHL09_20630 [Luteolibacter luteus]
MRSFRCLPWFLFAHSLHAASIEALPIKDAVPYSAAEDGKIVVGGMYPNAFIWNLTDGIANPGHLQIPQSGPNNTTEAVGVSSDGRMVIGNSTAYGQTTQFTRAFVWTKKRGMRPLGGSKNTESHAWSISANGKLVVGTISSDRGQQAAVWRNGKLAKRFRFGTVGTVVSADGHWVAGFDGNAGDGGLFRWSKKTGVQDLDFSDGAFNYPQAMSDDGDAIVGQGSDSTPFRWTLESGIQSLGILREDDTGYATSVNADGSVVVGALSPTGAFIWTQKNGLRELKATLESDFSLDLTGWHLSGARWISSDGTIIIGHGILNGTARTWVVRLT